MTLSKKICTYEKILKSCLQIISYIKLAHVTCLQIFFRTNSGMKFLKTINKSKVLISRYYFEILCGKNFLLYYYKHQKGRVQGKFFKSCMCSNGCRSTVYLQLTQKYFQTIYSHSFSPEFCFLDRNQKFEALLYRELRYK